MTVSQDSSICSYPTLNKDFVCHCPCASWPPQAKSWVTRRRVSNWPTREIIERIVSMGCSVVPKPHPESQKPAIEFRFSFSNAELILFEEMILEQKNCFITLKALVKYATGELKLSDGGRQMLSTYHLKTIFLWACETIEAKHWKTTRGWVNCLLFLFDQLIICLEQKSLPSYFISECNLLDGIEKLKSHQIIVEQVRLYPLKYAVEFMDSMKCFDWVEFEDTEYYINLNNFSSLSQSFNSPYNIILDPVFHQKISEKARQSEITDHSKVATLVHERERNFLQKLFQIKDNKSHGCLFRRKSCSLLASFANWYRENLNIKLSLFKEMTLLDAIRLENVHGLPIEFNMLQDIIEMQSTEICSGETHNVQTNTAHSVESSESLRLRAFSILFLLNTGQLEKARDELQYVISNNFLNASGVSFDISDVVMETGYIWLFGYGTMNSIREWRNVYHKEEVNVSAECFFQISVVEVLQKTV